MRSGWRARTVATSTGTTTTYRTGGHGFRPSNNAPTITTASSAGRGRRTNGYWRSNAQTAGSVRTCQAKASDARRSPPSRRCTSYWDGDLHSALCGWLTETKNRKNADILEKIGRSTTFRTEPDCPFCGEPVFVRIIETGDDRRWGFTVHHASPCNLEPLLQGLRPCDKAQEMADDFDRHWRKTVAAVKDTPDCPHCGRPPECACDHTSDLWSVGCGKCDKPNNGVSDDTPTAMASWREHTDAYRRSHDGEGLQNQLTEYWRKRGQKL